MRGGLYSLIFIIWVRLTSLGLGNLAWIDVSACLFLFKDDRKFDNKDYETSNLLEFCFKKGVSVETVKALMNEISILGESTLLDQEQVCGEIVIFLR